MTTGLAGCGGLPHTKDNVALCAALERTLDGSLSVRQLAVLTFEADNPTVSRQLHQDVATYIGFAIHRPDSSATLAAAQRAEDDCRSAGAWAG